MRSRSVFLLLFSAACGGSAPDSMPEIVATPLSGVAFIARASPGAAIVVEDFAEGREGDPIAEVTTDEDGRWMVDLGALSGTFLVTARTREGVAVSAVTDEVMVGEASTIVLSPVTRLAEAYFRHLVASGFGVDEARLKARRLFHLHFGRIDHHRIAPEDVTGASDRIGMLTPPVSAGILLAGLELLLEDLGAGSTSAVLETLADDVESDGVFDGRASREPLQFGLDGQALRLRYADAVRRFLGSPRNATAFGAADLNAVLAEIEQSRSELFPSGVVESDTEGPALSAFALIDERGSEVDPSRGVRGRARLSLAFEDPSGVTTVRIETDGGALADIDPGSARFEAAIDTNAYADGPITFTVVASDGAGNETRRDLVLLVDNTPPVLDLDTVSPGARAVATVTGSVSDATSGVDVLEASVFGQAAIVLETSGGTFSLDVPIACNIAEDIAVVARDRAGNEQRETVTAFCDDQAPVIRLVSSTFVQEGGLGLALDPNGSVIYSATAASSLMLDDRTPLPVRLEKYFNRLDAQSPNLPVIRFLVDDPGITGAAGDLEVGFRYLVDGVERRAFSVLSRPGAGEPYDIPISYPVLGTELATEGPTALHRIEIAAADRAGNGSLFSFDFSVDLLSPPVWLTACDTAVEVRNHTLAAGNFHSMYGANVETDVAEAALRFALDLGTGSLAPSGGVVVEPSGAVRTRVSELGEDKFQQASSHNFVVSSFQELGQYCPFNTPGVYLNQAGVNERTRVVDQTWACVQGLFPNEQTFPPAVANDDVPHPSSSFVTTGAGAAAPMSSGGYVLAPDAPFQLTLRMRDPVVRFQGALYDWSQDPRPPAGYVATVANANARYRMAPSLGFHHVGVDRWNVPNGGWPQERFFETRSYIRRIEIEAQPEIVTARHATLSHLRIDVRRDAPCSAPVVHRSQL